MSFIHRAAVHGRIKTALFAGLVFWVGMTLAAAAYFAPLGSHDFFIVLGVCLVGAILFGVAMSLRHPMVAPPSTKFDDGGGGLGVGARRIPPSPVLGARAFPNSDEKRA